MIIYIYNPLCRLIASVHWRAVQSNSVYAPEVMDYWISVALHLQAKQGHTATAHQ